MRVTVFCAISADGFLARPDGRLDWLDAANAAVPPGEDLGFAALLGAVGALIMGRATFDTVCSFGQWPYGALPVVVRSRRGLPTPPSQATVRVSDQPAAALLDALQAEGVNHVYIDGGQTIRDFLAQGLVTDLILTQIPVLIGEGIPLFGPLPADRPLRLLRVEATPYGFVQLHYTL